MTPLSRLPAWAQAAPETKARWEAEKRPLHPFALRREVVRPLRQIEAHRRPSGNGFA
jgi:hypothetical protein